MITIALTFDDAPGPSMASLLDVLHDADVKATFFVIGRNVEDPPWPTATRKEARDLLLRALRDGHVLGNHTYEHSFAPEIVAFRAEIERTDAIIIGLLGEARVAQTTIPFRFPYGERRSPYRLKVLGEMGRTFTPYPYLFEDWLPEKTEGGLLHEIRSHIDSCARDRVTTTTVDLHIGAHRDEQAGYYLRAATVEAVKLFLAVRGDWQFTTSAPSRRVE